MDEKPKRGDLTCGQMIFVLVAVLLVALLLGVMSIIAGWRIGL